MPGRKTRQLVLTPAGASDLDELKQHDFFAGIRWPDLRQQQAPDFVHPTLPSAEDEALDW